MSIFDKFKKPHSCDGEDRADPDSWDDPLIYDSPYYKETTEVEPPANDENGKHHWRNEVTPNDADPNGRRSR